MTVPNLPAGGASTNVSSSGPGFIPGTGRLDIYNLGELGDPQIGYPIMFDSATQPQGPRNSRGGVRNGEQGPVRSIAQPDAATPVTLTPLQMMDNMTLWGSENPALLLSLRTKLYARGFYGNSFNAANLDPLRTAVGDTDFRALGDAIRGYYAYTNAKATTGDSNLLSFNAWLAPKDKSGQDVSVGPDTGGGSSAGTAVAPQYDLAQAQSTGDAQAQSLLGRSVTSDQAGQLQGALNDNSAGLFAQGQHDNPSSFARSWLVSNNMDEYKSHQATGFMNAFLNLLSPNAAAPVATGDVAVGK